MEEFYACPFEEINWMCMKI